MKGDLRMNEENKYKASIIDMDVKTENRGATARMSFTVNIMSDIADGKIDRVALTKKISGVTDEITKAIKRSNEKGFTGEIMTLGGKEYIRKDGKLIPKK